MRTLLQLYLYFLLSASVIGSSKDEEIGETELSAEYALGIHQDMQDILQRANQLRSSEADTKKYVQDVIMRDVNHIMKTVEAHDNRRVGNRKYQQATPERFQELVVDESRTCNFTHNTLYSIEGMALPKSPEIPQCQSGPDRTSIVCTGPYDVQQRADLAMLELPVRYFTVRVELSSADDGSTTDCEGTSETGMKRVENEINTKACFAQQRCNVIQVKGVSCREKPLGGLEMTFDLSVGVTHLQSMAKIASAENKICDSKSLASVSSQLLRDAKDATYRTLENQPVPTMASVSYKLAVISSGEGSYGEVCEGGSRPRPEDSLCVVCFDLQC